MTAVGSPPSPIAIVPPVLDDALKKAFKDDPKFATDQFKQKIMALYAKAVSNPRQFTPVERNFLRVAAFYLDTAARTGQLGSGTLGDEVLALFNALLGDARYGVSYYIASVFGYTQPEATIDLAMKLGAKEQCLLSATHRMAAVLALAPDAAAAAQFMKGKTIDEQCQALIAQTAITGGTAFKSDFQTGKLPIKAGTDMLEIQIPLILDKLEKDYGEQGNGFGNYIVGVFHGFDGSKGDTKENEGIRQQITLYYNIVCGDLIDASPDLVKQLVESYKLEDYSKAKTPTDRFLEDNTYESLLKLIEQFNDKFGKKNTPIKMDDSDVSLMLSDSEARQKKRIELACAVGKLVQCKPQCGQCAVCKHTYRCQRCRMLVSESEDKTDLDLDPDTIDAQYDILRAELQQKMNELSMTLFYKKAAEKEAVHPSGVNWY